MASRRTSRTSKRSTLKPVQESPYKAAGVSGLRHYGGRISEEWLRKLQGKNGQKVYREMADNDDTLGPCLLLLEMFLRSVPWTTTPYSDDPLHVWQAEYIESLRHDMEHSWSEFMSEILSFMVYGHQLSEMVFKIRVGPDEVVPQFKSRHSDHLVGIRKLAPRGQESIWSWDIDAEGTVHGVVQQPPNGGGQKTIPYAKLLNFRTTSRLNNPEGRSALRNCVIAYHRKRDISEYEAIGVNRDLAGLARIRVPGRILQDDAPPELAGERERFEEILENLHNDEMAGLLLSSDRDQNGNLLYDFDLVNSGGTRAFNTSEIIKRYDTKLAQNFLADFIQLGHEKVGSFALSSDKTNNFAIALGGWMNGIAEELNRKLIPLIFTLNRWPTAELPRYTPGDLETEAIDQLASAIATLTAAGHLTPGHKETEDHLRRKLDLPELLASDEPIPMRAPSATSPQGQQSDADDGDEVPGLGGGRIP